MGEGGVPRPMGPLDPLLDEAYTAQPRGTSEGPKAEPASWPYSALPFANSRAAF